jgi:hypothetical protein
MGESSKAEVVAKVARKIRFPKLFALMTVLFVVDLAIPDQVPFIDEVMLGLMSAAFGMWRTRRAPALPPAAPPDRGDGEG